MKPFDILGVEKSASEEKIKKAYYKKIKETHPDLGGSKREFMRVKNAYEKIVSRRKQETSGEKEENKGAKSIVEYLNYYTLKNEEWVSDSVIGIFSEASEREDIKPENYGTITVNVGDSILEAAEKEGYTWPFSCRGGACANCAVKVVSGDVSTPKYAILDEGLLSKGYRLSCIGEALTPNVRIIYNVKNKDELEELLLPSQSEFD